MFVPIIMGSRADEKHGKAIAEALEALQISSELRIASAHKATSFLLSVLADYEEDPRPKVYITVAGRSNALSALVDANVPWPVIACPPYSDSFGGSDIYSSLRLPSGVAPAVVLEPAGAALLAAKMFGLSDAVLRVQIEASQEKYRGRIEADDRALRAEQTETGA